MLPFEILRYKHLGSNSLGQPKNEWESVKTLMGYLDLITGEEALSNTETEQSTHIFLTEDLSFWITRKDRLYNPRTKKTYEITFVDDPMELVHHLEVYVKQVSD